jgi:hypothetical protein
MKWFVLEFLSYEGYTFNECDTQEEAAKLYDDKVAFNLRAGLKSDDLILIKGEIVKRIP